METNYTAPPAAVPPVAPDQQGQIANVKELYGVGNMLGSALLAGLYGMVYMAYKNFQTLGEHEKAQQTLYYGMVGTTVLYAVLFKFLPDETSIGLALGGGAYAVVHIMQSDALKEHKEAGGAFKSIWKALGISLLSILAILVLLFGLILSGLVPLV